MGAHRRRGAAGDDQALLEAREGGKPLGHSKGAWKPGIGAVEQYAELGPLHPGKGAPGGLGRL